MSYNNPKMPKIKFGSSKVKSSHKVKAKDMETVELIHVGPPASLITHYLLHAGNHRYYHADRLDGIVRTLTDKEYQAYHNIRLELSRERIKIKNPEAAAKRLNYLIDHGYHFNLLTNNCIDFTNYVIYGKKSPKMSIEGEV